MTLLLDSSISACLAIAQVGKKGNTHAGWLPICGQVPKFCDRVTGSLIAGFAAAILYFLLLLFSFHNVLNLYTLKAQTSIISSSFNGDFTYYPSCLLFSSFLYSFMCLQMTAIKILQYEKKISTHPCHVLYDYLHNQYCNSLLVKVSLTF